MCAGLNFETVDKFWEYQIRNYNVTVCFVRGFELGLTLLSADYRLWLAQAKQYATSFPTKGVGRRIGKLEWIVLRPVRSILVLKAILTPNLIIILSPGLDSGISLRTRSKQPGDSLVQYLIRYHRSLCLGCGRNATPRN
jgi:hypothetical protein